MRKQCQSFFSKLRCQLLPVLAIALGLAVLAGIILWAKEQSRHAIQQQIASRDAEILYAMALVHQLPTVSGDTAPATEPVDQLNLMLEISRLKSVLAVRVFSPEGGFLNAFPPYIRETTSVRPEHLAQLRLLKPLSCYHPDFPLQQLVANRRINQAAPVLEVFVPLHPQGQSRLAGIAQFIIEGRSIAAEYAALDRHLNQQAAIAFLAGSAILAGGLAWAFGRLQKVNFLLKERTESLLQANQELVLAAKTSAVGTVTSHLLHGLKNPLAGLQDFVASRGQSPEANQAAWEQAETATRRMQTMIHDILGLLRAEQEAESCDLSLSEMSEMVVAKVQCLAREHGVPFTSQVESDRLLDSRPAQITTLVLTNLIENAIEATPVGQGVCLRVFDGPQGVFCEVQDGGPGVPAHLVPLLFVPGHTTKLHGSGLGLALCKQLAHHLEAELTLKSNGPGGCTFSLHLPEKLFRKSSTRWFEPSTPQTLLAYEKA
ncbi:MAG TPA: HAMP domain-containing sensor histidine kinase [Clostridia bacterium]|nr:HAMP domain-containing sensor histidine kinase [Clostridia bacterium]